MAIQFKSVTGFDYVSAATPLPVTIVGGGTGDVDGPASATDNAIVRFDGTTGKLIQDSVLIVADTTGALSGFGAGAGITFSGGGSIVGTAGSLDFAASGVDKSITLTPSGTGFSVFGGSHAGDANVIFYNSSATGYSASLYYNSSGTARGFVGWGNTSANPFPNVFQIGVLNGNVAIVFTMSGTGVMRIAASGNLLLGGLTTDGGADKQLQISGTNKVNFGATANATIGVSADTTAGVMTFTAPSAGGFLLTGGNTTLGGAYIGSTSTLSGPGAANVTTETTKITTTGVLDPITLADGTNGQHKYIIHDVDGGSFVLTPTTKTGWSTFTSTAAGESIHLLFVTTRGWIVVGSYLGTIAP